MTTPSDVPAAASASTLRAIRFRRAVLTHLLDIPYGGRESYTVVAEAAGNRKAVSLDFSACSACQRHQSRSA